MAHDPNLEDDASLVIQARAGNRSAFANLLNRYYPSVLRLCLRLLGSPWDAEDVAQETALQAFLGLERLKEPNRFSAWLHAIAANQARKVLRRRHTDSFDALGEATLFSLMWTNAAQPPEEVALASEIHELILHALNDLSQVNRDAVMSFYLSGYSEKQLAALEQVPISTIRGRLYQGRRQLEKALGPLLSRDEVDPRRKESRMEQIEWIPVQRSRFLFPFAPDGFASHTVIELRQVNGPWAFPLRINQAEGEILWKLPTDRRPEDLQPTSPVLQGWTLEIMKRLGIRVERLRIERLVDTAYYATASLVQGNQANEVEIRPGEALLLSAYTGAPVYVARSVIEAVGYNWEELLAYLNAPKAEQEHDSQVQKELRQKVVARVEKEKRETDAITVAPETYQQLEQLLERLVADSGARLAFIVDHEEGNLIAWTGAGNAEQLKMLARLFGARARSLSDLRDLLQYVHQMIGQVTNGDPMPFAQVGSHWQLDLVVPRATMDNANPTRQLYYEQAITELKRIIQQADTPAG